MEENKEIEKEKEIEIEKVKKHKPNKNEEIQQHKEKIESLNNEVLRSKADLINYRKRKDEETSSLLKFCNGDLILSLLTVVDNFERALILDDEAFKSYLDGFKLIYNQIIDILNSYEVKEIEALDKVFDPMYHQSVATKKDESKESGIVLEVFKKGYTYKDKVLRPAMVIINE